MIFHVIPTAMKPPSLRAKHLTSTLTSKLPTSHGPLTFQAAFHRFNRQSPASDIAGAIRADGACVIQSFYTPRQVRSFNADIDDAIARLVPGRPDADSEFLEAFHGSNTKRLWNLCSVSGTWREELVDDDLMHDICAEGMGRTSGDYWLSTAAMIEIGPKSEAQPLHTDGSQWWPFWEMGARSGNEMLLNFLVATTDTTLENGATRLIPGSHRLDYSDLSEDEQTPPSWRDEDAVPVPLNAGDCLLLGGRMVHKGGANVTEDQKRRVLTCTVVNSAFTPEEASPLLVGEDLREGLSDRARRFLGLGGGAMMPKGSVGVWQGEMNFSR